MEHNGLIEIEEKIIGILICNKDYRDNIFQLLENYVFDRLYRVIFKTLKDMHRAKDHIDNVTLAIEITNSGKMTPLINETIANAVINYIGAATYEYNCKSLLKGQLDKLIKSANSSDDLKAIQSLNEKINKDLNKSKFSHIGEDNNDLEHYYDTRETKILSGYKSLDNLTKGFYGGELIVIAAATGAGKTAFAINLSKRLAKKNKNILFISLEMSSREIRKRLNCSEIEINSLKIRGHELTPDQEELYFNNMQNSINKLPIYINKEFGLTIPDIESYALELQEDNKLDVIIIDYLTLIKTSEKYSSKREEILYITRSLKLLAMKLQVPVICLSQLSRATDTRQNKRPILSDLKESSSIEQDADIVIFLYRDEYYNKNTDKKGILEVCIAKGRDCPTGATELYFNKEYQQIIERQDNVYKAVSYIE